MNTSTFGNTVLSISSSMLLATVLLLLPILPAQKTQAGLLPKLAGTPTTTYDTSALSTCYFSDDFSNPSSGWPTSQGQNYFVGYEDGRYKMQMSTLVFWIPNPNTSCSDPSIEVDTTVVIDSNPYLNSIRHGVLFRYNDVNNWYAFEISSAGSYRILKRLAGTFINVVPWTFSSAINSGLATNHLSVRAIGSQITVGVNGQILTTTTDTSFSSGIAGLTAGTSVDQSIGVYFDNFVQTHTVVEPTLTINYADGSPGSFFTLTGANFPPNSMATVVVNGLALTNTLQVDGSGSSVFLLDTSQADSGRYFVTLTANPSATTNFTLDPALPLRPQEVSGIVVLSVPTGIAFNRFVYLPYVQR